MTYALVAPQHRLRCYCCVYSSCGLIGNNTKLEWLKQVLIPFMASLSRFINPEKK